MDQSWPGNVSQQPLTSDIEACNTSLLISGLPLAGKDDEVEFISSREVHRDKKRRVEGPQPWGTDSLAPEPQPMAADTTHDTPSLIQSRKQSMQAQLSEPPRTHPNMSMPNMEEMNQVVPRRTDAWAKRYHPAIRLPQMPIAPPFHQPYYPWVQDAAPMPFWGQRTPHIQSYPNAPALWRHVSQAEYPSPKRKFDQAFSPNKLSYHQPQTNLLNQGSQPQLSRGETNISFTQLLEDPNFPHMPDYVPGSVPRMFPDPNWSVYQMTIDPQTNLLPSPTNNQEPRVLDVSSPKPQPTLTTIPPQLDSTISGDVDMKHQEFKVSKEPVDRSNLRSPKALEQSAIDLVSSPHHTFPERKPYPSTAFVREDAPSPEYTQQYAAHVPASSYQTTRVSVPDSPVICRMQPPTSEAATTDNLNVPLESTPSCDATDPQNAVPTLSDVQRRPSLYSIPAWCSTHPNTTPLETSTTNPPRSEGSPGHRPGLVTPQYSNLDPCHQRQVPQTNTAPQQLLSQVVNTPNTPLLPQTHSSNFIIDIAETCERVFPFKQIAVRHDKPIEKVIEAFSAIIQVPLLRQADGQRRHEALAEQRLNAFREGRRRVAKVRV